MTKKQFESIIAWQKQTFPRSTTESKLGHLCEEIIELFAEIKMKGEKKHEEFADCFILLFGAAAVDGMSYEDICKAIDDKMAINRSRKWGKPDAFGVVRHIKSED